MIMKIIHNEKNLSENQGKKPINKCCNGGGGWDKETRLNHLDKQIDANI